MKIILAEVILMTSSQRTRLNSLSIISNIILSSLSLELQGGVVNGALQGPLNYKDRNTPKTVSHYS